MPTYFRTALGRQTNEHIDPLTGASGLESKSVAGERVNTSTLTRGKWLKQQECKTISKWAQSHLGRLDDLQADGHSHLALLSLLVGEAVGLWGTVGQNWLAQADPDPN